MAQDQGSAPSTPWGLKTPFGSVDLTVQWRDVTYTVNDREILKGLSGNMLPRRTLAIMGSSGAGKTTFLNRISDRLAHDAKHLVGGDVAFNGVPYDRKHRRLVGFVPQDDVLLPTATPSEVMSFSLRIRRGTTPEQTEGKVNDMLEELSLVKCKDTVVGIPGLVTGLSGGERKRANIGVELITDPKVLLLDEPTSGLDSVTAATVCKALRDLSRRGRTVGFTIHQPTSDCVEFFDDVLLLVGGKVVYHGAMDQAVEYFASVGFDCPEHYTPTDYFMTLMQSEETGPRLIELWDDHMKKQTEGGNLSPHVAPPSDELAEQTERYLSGYEEVGGSYGIQTYELMKRAGKGVLRNKMFLIATIVQAVVFGIIAALIFVNLQDTVTGVSDRHGLLFMVATNIGFSSIMNMVNSFPPERAVYIRDQQSGAYSPFLYFIAKCVSELPVQLIASILTSLLIYFPTRLHLAASNFFIFTAVSICTQQIGTGIGLAISVGIENYTVASGMTPVIIVPLMLANGFLASTDRLRWGWVWLEKISFMRYGLVLLERNEFEPLTGITCDRSEFGDAFCNNAPTTGKQVLHSLTFDDDHHQKWLMWVCIAVMFVLTRALAVFLLYVVARRKN